VAQDIVSHNLPTDRAGELIKPSEDAESLILKKFGIELFVV